VYPTWIAKIMLVRKKKENKGYVDFQDLNQVLPKDNFSFPINKLKIGDSIDHEVLSFIDGFSSYN
jgi:hypothetical protein